MIFSSMNYVGGENSSISPFLIDVTQLPVQNGVNTSWSLGAILKDPGFSRVDVQMVANQNVLGLFNFRQSSATQKMLATMNDGSGNTVLYYKTDAGVWTNIATSAWNTANQKVKMETFLGYCFFVGYNGTAFLPNADLTGTTWSTSDTNLTNMSQGKFIKRFRSRLYVANCFNSGTAYPYRVYYSDDPVAGVITWTPATDFIDVDFADEILGIEAAPFDRLLIFTAEKVYAYDQSTLNVMCDVGTQNQEVIQSHSVYTIWSNTDGVWVTTGGQPQNVGGQIIDFIRNSDPTQWFSALVDEEYWFYVGNVTVNGISYANHVKIYNFQTNSWRGRELSRPMTSFAKYNSTSGTGKRLYMGDTTGTVWNKAKYSDTNTVSADEQTSISDPTTGKPISVNFELAPMNLGDWSTSKRAENMVAYANRAGGLKLKMRILDRNSRAITPYLPLGELKKYVNPLQIEAGRGTIIQIAGAENSINPYFSFYGFEIDVTRDSDALRNTNK